MRPRPILYLVSLLVFLFAIVALAQPKKGAKDAKAGGKEADDKALSAKGSDKAAEKGENGKAEVKAESSEPAEPAPAGGSDDLGEPPPKTSADKGETKLSPLNPAANEFPDGGLAPTPVEYDRLLGDIAALRSRVAALTTTLFASKLRVIVETRSDDARIASLAVTLDDGVVFSAPERFSAEDEKVVYEHAVAPGHHVVGIEVERYDSRAREYRTWQSSKFSVVVPENKLVEAHIIVEDDSDMAVDFPDDQDGEYELNVRLRARVTE